MSVNFALPDYGAAHWREVPENPLIGYEQARVAIGDPQVLLPGEFDDQWHIFFHGYMGEENRLSFFHHVSDDGLHWQEKKRWDDWTVGQNYLFCDGERWIMYYTSDLRFLPGASEGYDCGTLIRAKTTLDFENWSEEVDLILPESDLEREGRVVEARNPCMIALPDGGYRLYYSAGTVWLDDTDYEEPKYIFCAHADHPLGPFTKTGAPVLAPDAAVPHRNYGCGAIKVFGYRGGYLGFYNPIYLDEKGNSRSQICLVASEDGLLWEEAPCNPVMVPTEGWRKAIVYQLDVVRHEGKLWMYFNARDDWYNGIERIGCCQLALAPGDEGPIKLQKPFAR